MKKYHIELTDEEKALVQAIDLRTAHSNHDEGHTAYKANQRPILALLESLSERGAIPEGRLNYWNDPDYYTGRLKASHKGVFERGLDAERWEHANLNGTNHALGACFTTCW